MYVYVCMYVVCMYVLNVNALCMYVCNLLTNVILGTRITGIRGPQALALAPYNKIGIKKNSKLSIWRPSRNQKKSQNHIWVNLNLTH